MSTVLRGIVHGKIIELNEDLGVAEGQEVEVQVKLIPKTPTSRERALFVPRAPWPTTRNGMRSWRKFTGPESWNDGHRYSIWGNNEIPPGYRHLLGPHAPPCEVGPPLYSTHDGPDDRICGASARPDSRDSQHGGFLQHSEPAPRRLAPTVRGARTKSGKNPESGKYLAGTSADSADWNSRMAICVGK